MFDFVVGLGQGGGRLAYSFGKGFDVPTVYLNLAGVDFARLDTARENILVFEEGGTGRNPLYGEQLVRDHVDDMIRFFNKGPLQTSKYILVCVGGGGGAGTGFLFAVLDLLLATADKEVFVVFTLPEAREGIPTKPNALGALDRLIHRYTGKISLMLVDNDYCLRRYGSASDCDYWGGINGNVVNALKRFWLLTEIDRFAAFIDVASGYKALDKNDVRRVLFSRYGYTDIRLLSFPDPQVSGFTGMFAKSSALFHNLDARTTRKYIVSIGIPDAWKNRPETRSCIEQVFEELVRATKRSPDVLRCSYFNKKLDTLQVNVLLSGIARGGGIDRLMDSTRRDEARMDSYVPVERILKK